MRMSLAIVTVGAIALLRGGGASADPSEPPVRDRDASDRAGDAAERSAAASGIARRDQPSASGPETPVAPVRERLRPGGDERSPEGGDERSPEDRDEQAQGQLYS